MVVYVKQSEKEGKLIKLFNLKIEHIQNINIINIILKKNEKNKTVIKKTEKLIKYLKKNNINNIVLEQKLMQNTIIRNLMFSNNIKVIDGNIVNNFLLYDAIQKIYKYKNKNLETGEITILVNSNSNINIQNITKIAQNAKRINIITNDIKKFKKTVDYLYNEFGILIKLTNNMKTNIKNSDIILNLDYSTEKLNQLEIPRNSVVINMPENVSINVKKFSGINIKGWTIEIPNKYKMDGFSDISVYEANLYKKTFSKIVEQIQLEDIKIKEFIGTNGIIDKKEFKY